MATSPAANPIYHDPTLGRTRPRRSSSRKSFASPLSRSTSQLDSPRAVCPKDGDAFSYDPTHLRMWYLPQELWDQLPVALRSSLASVQHSGAAVLTGKFASHSYTGSMVIHGATLVCYQADERALY
jgi:hypothetical protein